MTKNINYVSHKKSKLKTNDGKPQLPSSSALVEGEIAINYAKDVETLSIKNESGTVVTFSSDNYYTEQKLGSGFTSSNSAKTVTEVIVENEQTVAAALNDLKYTKLDASAYTPTDLSNYYTKSETSGKTEISNALGSKVNTATFIGHTADTSVHFSGSEKENLDALADNIAAISGITAQDINNWNTGAGVDLSNYYKKTETSGSTELSTAFGNKADTATTIAGYGITDAKIANQVITLGSNSITVSSATQVNTALGNKANTSDLNGYADSVKYNSTTKYVEFYHGTTAGTKVFEYDASPFLIDGMVQNVEIKDVTSGASQVTCLVISFNTDAGKQDINIPLTDIFNANNYYTKTDIDNLVGSGFTSSSITEVIIENEQITSSALNDIESGKTDVSAFTAHTADTTIHHTHTNKTYLDGIIGTVGTMAYQNASSYSSATQVNTALGNKIDKTEYATFSAATNTSISDLSAQSETVAAALVNLNDNKLDITAYTPADLSNYYTKSETNSALLNKQDVSGMSSYTTTATTNSLSGTVTAHTADSSVHVTSSDKTTWNAVTAKTDTSTFNTHTASTVHMSTTEKTNLDSLATNIGAISGITSAKVTSWDNAVSDVADLSGQSETIAVALNDLNDNKVSIDSYDTDINNIRRRTRLTDFSLDDLKKAVADQDLEKYGLKVGDEKTINGYTYVIAGLNCMRGTHSCRVTKDHVGLIVIPHTTQAWNVSGNTYQSTNIYSTGGTEWTSGSSAGYANCDLHYYLTNTVLPHAQNDLGSSNLISHYKLYSTAVNTSGYNRYGSAGGCSSSWAWYANQYISALSEIQVYGSIVWSSSGYDTGEACRQLDVFRVYNMNEIFGNEYPWLRDVASASRACLVNRIGFADLSPASYAFSVAALILFA